MLFNPLFIQPAQTVENGAATKPAKLNNTSYLFSDIIKVFHLSSQLKGETVADNSTGDAKLLNAFLDKIKDVKGISFSKAADGTVTFNLNGSSDLLQLIKNLLAGSADAPASAVNDMGQDSIQKLFATKEDFIGFLNQFMSKIAPRTDGSKSTPENQNAKDSKAAKSDSATIEAIVATILLNNQAALNLNFGGKQVKVEIVKSSPDQNINSDFPGFNLNSSGKSQAAGYIKVSVSGADSGAGSVLAELQNIEVPSEASGVLSGFKMNLATTQAASAAANIASGSKNAPAENTPGEPAALKNTTVIPSSAESSPGSPIAAELKTVAGLGELKNLMGLKSSIENALAGKKQSGSAQSSAQKQAADSKNTSTQTNTSETGGGLKSELKTVGDLKPVVEFVGTEKTQVKTSGSPKEVPSSKQNIVQETIAAKPAADAKLSASEDLPKVKVEKQNAQVISDPGKNSAVNLKTEIKFSSTNALKPDNSLKSNDLQPVPENVNSSDANLGSEIKAGSAEKLQTESTIKATDFKSVSDNKNNADPAFAGGNKPVDAAQTGSKPDLQATSQNNSTTVQQSADAKSNISSGGENQAGDFNDTSKRDGNKESLERQQAPIMQTASAAGRTGISKPIETFIPNNPEIPFKTVNAADILKEVSGFIQKAEKSSIILKLKPESLGKIKIALDVVDKSVHAHLQVDNDTVRQVVQSNINDLRQTLASAGLQLSTFDVALSGSDHKHAKNFGSKKKFGRQVPSGSAEDDAEMAVSKNMGYNTYEYLI